MYKPHTLVELGIHFRYILPREEDYQGHAYICNRCRNCSSWYAKNTYRPLTNPIQRILPFGPQEEQEEQASVIALFIQIGSLQETIITKLLTQAMSQTINKPPTTIP
eukprot:TRINITY_DN12990_c0_g1_i1.p2 TRINITY_DN12990_c0_g1~~TRINITY_DN12990_c0_g1_i1.p2  ORF type:complete len:107 (+),score=7.34 TRINITY_DN12990_c0_g1_i1:291-611(+)